MELLSDICIKKIPKNFGKIIRKVKCELCFKNQYSIINFFMTNNNHFLKENSKILQNKMCFLLD
jgi:hypothetical protein